MKATVIGRYYYKILLYLSTLEKKLLSTTVKNNGNSKEF